MSIAPEQNKTKSDREPEFELLPVPEYSAPRKENLRLLTVYFQSLWLQALLCDLKKLSPVFLFASIFEVPGTVKVGAMNSV
ncbi:hypothetical protein D3C75_1282210 [compost metagenome]